MDNVGGSMFWATTAELQSGIPGVPDEYGLKAIAFVDAGSVFHYAGPTAFRVPHNRCRSPTTMSYAPRSARA
jgi:outer membrane protein assembly factor BamA